MARRKEESPQKKAMREMMKDYLKNSDVKIQDGSDVNSAMRDMMSILLEGVLDEELDEELGYTKYDYRNKDTDNSRNGHSSKTMHTSYEDMESHLRELYDIEISDSTISRVTDKILPIVREWQERPWEVIYNLDQTSHL